MLTSYFRGLTATMILLSLTPSVSATDVLVGMEVRQANRVALDQVDHTMWDGLLRQHVNDAGQVDYRSWKASAPANQQLDAYLATLSTGDPGAQASPAARFAYWINAYNAVTIKGILREYPTTSIRNHTAKLWGYNIWKNLKLRAGREPISLETIEHQVLRPMGDPRVHFAIVCASIGCPRLLNEAYTAARLEEQLHRNARHFFAQPQNFRIEPDKNMVALSSILKWFEEDFGKTQAERLRTISPWLPSEDAQRFVAQPGLRVQHLAYDWNLNEQPER